MLKINNLHASVDGTEILKGIDLAIKPGEVHAIMGPNGSGKSTLANVLGGREDYEVTKGDIIYNKTDILDMDPDERAILGLFIGFQYPVEIPGVACMTFLKEAVNAIRKGRGEEELDAAGFLKLVKSEARKLNVDMEMLKRSVNSGFSGGEKKRHEILQMAMLDPKFAVLDETDSGLDIDALKTVAAGVNNLRSPDRAMLIITHYQRLLDYIEPDQVHILSKGRIVRSGDKDLAKQLEAQGYDAVIAQAA